MTVKILSLDQDNLPNRLLDEAKVHLRVDYDGEDDFIKSCIRRSIARFQNVNDFLLNQTSVLWTPTSAEFVDGAATIPVRPVTDFTATADPSATDVKANYSVALKWNGVTGIPIQVLNGSHATGLVLTLACGVPGGPPGPPPELDITPAALDVILRHTAHLYEHREILIPGKEYLAPDLRLDATLWMPRL